MKEGEILKNISSKLGINKLNRMQRELAEKSNTPDMVVLSPTGSGKTLAFTIPVLKNMRPSSGAVQAVILAPSRELAVQIGKVVQAAATGYKTTCCYGGHSFEDEKNSLSVTPDILVGTPGRILDHLKRGNLDVHRNRILVLDEFDKSLELGFLDEMGKIIRRMPNVSRRILTSATPIEAYPEFLDMESAATFDFLQESNNPTERMQIYNVKSDLKDKLESLLLLLRNLRNGKTIIFANYRESAERIHEFLEKHHLPVGIYHGGLDQIEREKAVMMFNNGTFMVLTTTDLGSRGLDIQEVEHIIHYHLPQTKEIYTHRNGRTARVNATGCIYVITGPNERIPDFIQFDEEFPLDQNAEMQIDRTFETLFFSAGKKEKISRGDILGFLVAKGGLDAKEIGKIDIADHYALAAIPANKAEEVLAAIVKEKIKNKRIRISIARQ